VNMALTQGGGGGQTTQWCSVTAGGTFLRGVWAGYPPMYLPVAYQLLSLSKSLCP